MPRFRRAFHEENLARARCVAGRIRGHATEQRQVVGEGGRWSRVRGRGRTGDVHHGGGPSPFLPLIACRRARGSDGKGRGFAHQHSLPFWIRYDHRRTGRRGDRQCRPRAGDAARAVGNDGPERSATVGSERRGQGERGGGGAD